MFSYTSAISKKWLAIVFHGLKLGNVCNPFGHFFGHFFRHPFRHFLAALCVSVMAPFGLCRIPLSD